MKSSFFSIFILLALILGACSQSKLINTKVEVLDAGTLSILMYDESDLKNSYRVYVNGVDSGSTLLANGVSDYQVKQGLKTIQFVRGRETASIKIKIKKNGLCTLRVIEDEKGHIELLQVANSFKE